MVMPVISAEILIEQSDYLYNLGDQFKVNITVFPSITTNDFLVSSVHCSNGEVELYRNFLSLNANEQKNVELSMQFGQSLLKELEGNCYLHIKYGGDEVNSRDFIITKSIDVSLSITGASFDPGSEIIVIGNAKKKNGQLLEGFVEAEIEGLNGSVFAYSSAGVFNLTFHIPADAKSGNYNLKVRVYEKDNTGSIANEGQASAVIKINQIVEKLEIAVDSDKVKSGSLFKYSVNLYDQSDLKIKEDLSVIFYRPDGSIFIKKLVRSGETIEINFALNESPGYWTIEGNWRELRGRRAIYIDEIQDATMVIENQTLIITNVGNVPYRRILEIFIGSENELKEVKLDVGETKRYKVSAKDGEYDISISDGTDKRNLGRSYLTGNAVDIREIGSISGGKVKLTLWVIILLILAVVAFIYYKKIRKRVYLGKVPSMSITKDKNLSNEEGIAKKLSGSLISGKKEEAALIALKIKNLSELLTSENNALPAIERAIEKSKNYNARVYEQGEYKTIILSPTMMKEEQVVGKALSLAEEISFILNEYNKHYALKINYGIGIHLGDMIIESNREGKIRFTSVGSTTIIPKRAADRSNGFIYLSEIVHRRMLGKIKCEKISSEGYWKLNQIVRRDEHKDFINKFMKNQSDDKAKKAGFLN